MVCIPFVFYDIPEEDDDDDTILGKGKWNDVKYALRFIFVSNGTKIISSYDNEIVLLTGSITIFVYILGSVFKVDSS